MNYQEARAYLDETAKYGNVLGLDSMTELLKRLGNPQDELKFIHIAGTNGKGSVLSYLSGILSAAGFKTGRYISPTLYSYRERIQVDGQVIEREVLAELVEKIAAATEEMTREGIGHPTVFEVETALSFLYFRQRQCDMVVLETGLGGRLDATNVVKTTVMEIMTPIGMDHMDYLGNTLKEIAWNKTGIIKENTLVVSAVQEPEAEEMIRQACTERHCRLQMVDNSEIRDVSYGMDRQVLSYKNWRQTEISLAGTYQIANAALALEAAEGLRHLGYNLTEEQVRKGMKEAKWRGRFTIVRRNPVVLLDGAHNPAAAKELKESLELYFKGKELYFIFGVFADKEYEKVIELTAPLAKHIVTVQTPGNPRALPAEELKKAVELVNPSVEWAESIQKAVKVCMEMAEEEDVIVAFGSLSYLKDVDVCISKFYSHSRHISGTSD